MEFHGRAHTRGGGHPHADGAVIRWCQDGGFTCLTVLCLCIPHDEGAHLVQQITWEFGVVGHVLEYNGYNISHKITGYELRSDALLSVNQSNDSP